MDNIRVLQLGRFFPPHIGGTENVILDLFQGLNGRGIKTDVLCCNDTNVYEETIQNGAKVIRTKTIIKIGSIAVSFQQISMLRKIWKEYDVIHVHHPAPMANIALWVVRPTCRLIVYWHSDIVRQKLMLFFYKPFQNWLLKRASAVVATTPEYIKNSESLRLFPEKTSFIPIGVSKLDVKNTELLEHLKKKYQNKKVVFSLGRLVGYKGFKYLIDAAQYLDPSYIILIGGSGPLQQELENQIQINGLSEKVTLLGRLSNKDLPSYFMLCDLYCMASITKNEAFGLVLPEAMSLSKPVVATRIPGSGVQWVNEDFVSGLNVEIKNPKSIADAIRGILEDEDVKRKYSDGAFKRFTTLFEKTKMIESFSTLYSKVCASI